MDQNYTRFLSQHFFLEQMTELLKDSRNLKFLNNLEETYMKLRNTKYQGINLAVTVLAMKRFNKLFLKYLRNKKHEEDGALNGDLVKFWANEVVRKTLQLEIDMKEINETIKKANELLVDNDKKYPVDKNDVVEFNLLKETDKYNLLKILELKNESVYLGEFDSFKKTVSVDVRFIGACFIYDENKSEFISWSNDMIFEFCVRTDAYIFGLNASSIFLGLENRGYEYNNEISYRSMLRFRDYWTNKVICEATAKRRGYEDGNIIKVKGWIGKTGFEFVLIACILLCLFHNSNGEGIVNGAIDYGANYVKEQERAIATTIIRNYFYSLWLEAQQIILRLLKGGIESNPGPTLRQFFLVCCLCLLFNNLYAQRLITFSNVTNCVGNTCTVEGSSLSVVDVSTGLSSQYSIGYGNTTDILTLNYTYTTYIYDMGNKQLCYSGAYNIKGQCNCLAFQIMDPAVVDQGIVNEVFLKGEATGTGCDPFGLLSATVTNWQATVVVTGDKKFLVYPLRDRKTLVAVSATWKNQTISGTWSGNLLSLQFPDGLYVDLLPGQNIEQLTGAVVWSPTEPKSLRYAASINSADTLGWSTDSFCWLYGTANGLVFDVNGFNARNSIRVKNCYMDYFTVERSPTIMDTVTQFKQMPKFSELYGNYQFYINGIPTSNFYEFRGSHIDQSYVQQIASSIQTCVTPGCTSNFGGGSATYSMFFNAYMYHGVGISTAAGNEYLTAEDTYNVIMSQQSSGYLALYYANHDTYGTKILKTPVLFDDYNFKYYGPNAGCLSYMLPAPCGIVALRECGNTSLYNPMPAYNMNGMLGDFVYYSQKLNINATFTLVWRKVGTQVTLDGSTINSFICQMSQLETGKVFIGPITLTDEQNRNMIITTLNSGEVQLQNNINGDWQVNDIWQIYNGYSYQNYTLTRTGLVNYAGSEIVLSSDIQSFAVQLNIHGQFTVPKYLGAQVCPVVQSVYQDEGTKYLQIIVENLCEQGPVIVTLIGTSINFQMILNSGVSHLRQDLPLNANGTLTYQICFNNVCSSKTVVVLTSWAMASELMKNVVLAPAEIVGSTLPNTLNPFVTTSSTGYGIGISLITIILFVICTIGGYIIAKIISILPTPESPMLKLLVGVIKLIAFICLLPETLLGWITVWTFKVLWIIINNYGKHSISWIYNKVIQVSAKMFEKKASETINTLTLGELKKRKTMSEEEEGKEEGEKSENLDIKRMLESLTRRQNTKKKNYDVKNLI